MDTLLLADNVAILFRAFPDGYGTYSWEAHDGTRGIGMNAEGVCFYAACIWTDHQTARPSGPWMGLFITYVGGTFVPRRLAYLEKIGG